MREIRIALVALVIICASWLPVRSQLNCSGGPLRCAPPLTTALGGTNVTSPGSANNILVSDGTNWTSATVPGTATICSNTAASTAITGTSSKTYFNLNCAIPANTLSAGKTISLEARGVYSGNATDTLIMTGEFCSVSGCGSGVVIQAGTSSALTLLAVSNQYWEGSLNSIAFTAGSGGTVDTQGRFGYETAATTMVYDAVPNTGTQTINTTIQQFLSISVKFSTNSGSDSITLRNFRVIIQ